MAYINSEKWLDENEEFVYKTPEGEPLTKEEYMEAYADKYDFPDVSEDMENGKEVDGKMYISDAEIERSKFYGNDAIREVYIEDTKGAKIGAFAFADCENLREVHLTEQLKEIPDGLFRYDDNLHRIKLPQETERIGDVAFEGCMQLNFIHIPPNTREIGESAFERCEQIIDVGMKYAKKLEKIGDYAFAECSNTGWSIPTLYIPDSVKSVGRGVFSYSEMDVRMSKDLLKKLDIDSVFEGYDRDRNSGMIEKIKEMADHKLPYMDDTGMYYDGTINICQREATAYEHIEISDFDKFKEFISKSDHDRLMEFETEIKSMIKLNFDYGDRGTHTWLLEMTEKIDNMSIDKLAKMIATCRDEEMMMDAVDDTLEGYTRDGDMLYADEEKTILEEYKGDDEKVVVPDGVKVIRQDAFFQKNVSSVVLPDTLETIEPKAFQYSDIKEIKIPDSVKTIGVEAFSNCGELEHVVLPKDLEEIEKGTFDWCKNLADINIPEKVEVVGDYAFRGCNLTELYIPDSVEVIGLEAFACNHLKNVSISDDLLEKTDRERDGVEKVFVKESIRDGAYRAYNKTFPCEDIAKQMAKRVESIRSERGTTKERNTEKHARAGRHCAETEASLA